MNEIHMDYGFLGKEDEARDTIPMMVVKERTSKMLMAAVCPRKTTGVYIQKRITGFLREIGCLHGDLVVKSDQEPALDKVIEDVGKGEDSRRQWKVCGGKVDGQGECEQRNGGKGASYR